MFLATLHFKGRWRTVEFKSRSKQSRQADDSLLRPNRHGPSVQRTTVPDFSSRPAPLLPNPHVTSRQLRLQRSEKQLTDFTVSSMVAQRQALAPMLEGMQLQREVLNVEGPVSQRQSLQRQIEDHQSSLGVGQLKAGQYEAAVQRQADLQAPIAPLSQRPSSPAQWSQGGLWEVQRVADHSKPGQTISLREHEQAQHLGVLRTVGVQLGQGFRSDTGPVAQRYAEYGEALAPFQRLGTGTGRAVVTTALMQVPVSQRQALQRAIDDTIQRQQAQETQDRAIIGLHSLQRQLEHLDGQSEQPLMERIQARRGAGNPIPGPLRKALELELNHDLGRVRLHDDSEADTLSKSVQALAFTTGQDIFFKAGTFNPNTRTGVELIAHEVTHTVQQAQGRAKPGIDGDAGLETEARAMGRAVASRPGMFGRSGGLSSGVPLAGKTPEPGLVVPGRLSVQRLQTGAPPSAQKPGQADPLLAKINLQLGLKLKSAQALYPVLKTDSIKRTQFFQGLYSTVPPTSELGRLLSSSKVPLIQAYVQGLALHAKGKQWDAFPESVKRLFRSAGVVEQALTTIYFGGKASLLVHNLGGIALVKGTQKNIEVRKEVRFNAIGTFPKGLTFKQAKSTFLAKATLIWSNTHRLVLNDSKNAKFHQELPIKVAIGENSASKETINIYGSAFGRSNANGTTLKIYVHDENGAQDPQFALVAAHEVGHFLLGVPDEYKDVIDPKTHLVTGSKSTTNDHSVMANFYQFPKQVVSHARHFSELLVNFRAMYPGKQVSIK